MSEVYIKQPSEVRVYSIDFVNLLATADALTAVTSVTVTPTGPTIGTGTISTTKVQFSVSGGTDGQRYVIEAIATTTGGETLEGDGILLVLD